MIWPYSTAYVGGYMHFLTKVILATPVVIFGAVMLSAVQRRSSLSLMNLGSSMDGTDDQLSTTHGLCAQPAADHREASSSTSILSHLPEDQCCSLAARGTVRGPTYTGFPGQKTDTKVVSFDFGRMRKRY